MASTSTKPTLSTLSVASASTSSDGHHHHHHSPSGSSSRRIASWSSSYSDVGSMSGYVDRSMTPLPSPGAGRDWGFFGGSAGGSRSSFERERDLSYGGSLGRQGSGKGRTSSVFEEMRDPPLNEFGGSSGSGGGWSDGGWSGDGGGGMTSPGSISGRSKTLSFFDAEDSMVISPPPNPLSRGNSLNKGSTTSPALAPARLPSSVSSVSLNGDASTTSSAGRLAVDAVPTKRNGPRSSWLELDPETSSSVWTRSSGASVEIGTRSRSHTSSSSPDQLEPRPPPSPSSSPPSTTSNKPTLPALQTSSIRYMPNTHVPSSANMTPSISSARPLTSLPTPGGTGGSNTPINSYPTSSSPPSSSALPTVPGSRFLSFSASHASHPRPSQINPSLEPRSSSALSFASSSGGSRPSGSTGRGGGNETPITPSMEEVRLTDSALSGVGEEVVPQRGDVLGDFVVEKLLGKGSFSRVALASRRKGKGKDSGGEREREGEMVALKMIARKSHEGNERMRISVVREVEVLKNIRHPSLVSLSSSFSTPIYTVLVLDYAPGGELFDFLADWHSSIQEPLARRIFGELADAVGWMHSIGLVHRDIKLENILLLSRPFPTSTPSSVLSNLPTPFVKLTDFGLSRFLSPTSPLLTTRCGSEAYAAPELIMASSTKPYDGRRTDAWALGVVLYAIVTGVLPFVEQQGAGRRAYLLRIAKGEYVWPENASGGEGVREVVRGLLQRDGERRWRVEEVFGARWLKEGEGRVERRMGRVVGGRLEREEWGRRGSEFVGEEREGR